MYSVNVSAWPQVLFIIWLFPTIIPESTKCNSKCQTGHKLVYVQMISCLNMQATSLPLVMYEQFCPFNIFVQTPQDATEWGTILDNWGANTLRLLSLVGVPPCVLQSQYVCSFMFSVRVCSLARLTPHSWSGSEGNMQRKQFQEFVGYLKGHFLMLSEVTLINSAN